MVLLKYVIFPVITPNISKLSLEMLILLQICSFYQWNDLELILFHSVKDLFIFFEIV